MTAASTFLAIAKGALKRADSLPEFHGRVANHADSKLCSESDAVSIYRLGDAVDIRIETDTGFCTLAFAGDDLDRLDAVQARRKFPTSAHHGVLPFRSGSAVTKPAVSFSGNSRGAGGQYIAVYLDGLDVGALMRFSHNREWKLSLKINLECMPGLTDHGCGRRLADAKKEVRRVILARLRDASG